MLLFDPHAHMFSRVTDDYERMALCGIRAVLEPAFWLGQNRTSVGSFADYFDTLIGWERFRARQFGIHHFCTLALNPREANDDRVNEGVVQILPRYLEKDGVVGVGEIGLDDQTATEEKFFQVQIELAKRHDLPVLVHTPHRDKKRGFERSIAILRESGIPLERALLDHGTEETVPLTRDLGCYQGFSIYPDTKMDPQRMVAIVKRWGVERMIVNSAADWGASDPLMVPRTVHRLRLAHVDEAAIQTLVWSNPIAFFAQSGRLSEEDLRWPAAGDLGQTFEGNSILRGEPLPAGRA